MLTSVKQIRFSAVVIPAILLITGIASLGWWLFPKLTQETASPYKAIPPDAALILRINRPVQTTENLESKNQLWKELCLIPEIESFRETLLQVDSLVRRDDDLMHALQKNPLLISMIRTGKTEFGYLFIAALDVKQPGEKILRLAEDRFGDELTVTVSKYGDGTIMKVGMRNQNSAFWFTVRKGIFLGSFHAHLLKKSIDQLSLNIPSILNTHFSTVEQIAGKKTDATLFISYPMIYPFLERQLQESWVTEAYKAASFAGWTVLDLSLGKDEVALNGYTLVTDTSGQYAGIYSGQIPQKILVPAILPSTTVSLVFTGISDMAKYYRSFQAFVTQKSGFSDPYPELARIQRLNHMDFSDNFIPWIGKEMCLATALPHDTSIPAYNYAVFRMNDPYLADSLLERIRHVPGLRPVTRVSGKNLLVDLGLPGLLPSLFGKKYATVTGSCYSFVDEYAVFSNDFLSLEYLIEQYQRKNTLNVNPRFIGLAEHQITDATSLVWFNTPSTITRLKAILREELMEPVAGVIDSLKKFESLTLRLVNSPKGLSTSLLLTYNPLPGNDGPKKWEAALDTLMSGQPQIFFPTSVSISRILVMDVSNTLYAFDPGGKLQWKVKLSAKPLGTISQVVLPDQDTVFIFNTSANLVAIRRNGSAVNGFPLKLPEPALSGLTTAAGPDGKTILFIPVKSAMILAYRIGDKKPYQTIRTGMAGEIETPVQVLKTLKKEYLAVKSTHGEVSFHSTDGQPAIRLHPELRVDPQSTFYINLTNKKGIFLTQGLGGKVVYIAENGKTTTESIRRYPHVPLFLYDDINRNGSWNFIFYEGNKLDILNRLGRMVYSYLFTREITVPPYLIRLPDGTPLIGAVAGPSGEVYLFGKDGLLKTERRIRGNTPFCISELTNDGTLDVIIGYGKYLRCYALPKE